MTRSYLIFVLFIIIITIILILIIISEDKKEDKKEDKNINVYITGFYKEEAFFRDKGNNSHIGATLPNTDSSKDASFVTKYNDEGIVQWAALQNGTDDDFSRGITNDNNDNIYITGFYKEGTSFYSQGDNDNPVFTLPNSGNNDSFLAKYNSNGIVQWAAHQGGTGSDQGRAVASDSNDNIYITGNYSSSGLSFYSQGDNDNPVFTLPNKGSFDSFLAKYSSTGNVIWAALQGGTGIDVGFGIATDNFDNIYIGSRYSTGCSFYDQGDNDNPVFTLPNTGNDGFLAKYSSAGNVSWAARQGGTGIDDFSYAAATDSTNNIYIGGTHSNGCSFYSQGDTDNPIVTLPSKGGSDSFLAKYSSTGIVKWAALQGGPGLDNGYAVAVDNSDNIYISGYYGNAGMSFYSQGDTDNPVVTLPNIGGRDIFLAKYNKEGIVIWATHQGSTGSDESFGVATDSDNNIYITGYYKTTGMSFYSQGNNIEPSFTLLSTGESDENIFTAKYNNKGKFLWAAAAGPSVSGGDNTGYSIAVSN